MAFEGEVQLCRHPWHSPTADQIETNERSAKDAAAECAARPTVLVPAVWVVDTWDGKPDHACLRCVPDERETVLPGFVCVYHTALDVLADMAPFEYVKDPATGAKLRSHRVDPLPDLDAFMIQHKHMPLEAAWPRLCELARRFQSRAADRDRYVQGMAAWKSAAEEKDAYLQEARDNAGTSRDVLIPRSLFKEMQRLDIREAWLHAYTSLGCDRANAEKMVDTEISAYQHPNG